MFWQLLFFISSSHAVQQTLNEPTCTNNGSSRTIRLSVNSTKGPTGVWSDTLSGWTEFSNSSAVNQMDIAHTVTECKGKRILNIKGIIQAPPYEETIDKLKFHPRCGVNIAIMNKGFTAQLLSLDQSVNSPVFTNRPINDEEVFEVKLGVKNKCAHNLGIGIMTKSPSDVDILTEMYKSPHVWIFHDINIYNNIKAVRKHTGRDTNTFKSGDRIGVMRSEMGTLHYFLNGEDLGPAISNVPPIVYGVVDLRGCFEKVTIINGS